MTGLYSYRELFKYFRQVYSNSKELSNLLSQNKYSNSKSTYDVKPKFFLCTKLPWKVLLANYAISALAALQILW